MFRFAYSPERDLQNFSHWNEFETEIHNMVTAHMANMNILPGAEYDIGSMPKKQRSCQGVPARDSRTGVAEKFFWRMPSTIF